MKRLLMAAAAATVLAGICASSASAVGIASWGQAVGGTSMTYTNPTDNGIFADATITGATTVNLDFLNGFGGVLAGDAFLADLTISGGATPASSVVGNTQTGDTLTFTFTYSAADPQNLVPDGSVVLTGTITDGDYSIALGSTGLLANTITFSSPYDANVALATDKGGSFTFTALTDTPIVAAADGLDFTSHTSANLSGVVSGNLENRVPEPGTLAMLVGMGVSGSLFGLRLRRR